MIKTIKNHKIEIKLYWNATLWKVFNQFIENGLSKWIKSAEFKWKQNIIGQWKDLWEKDKWFRRHYLSNF